MLNPLVQKILGGAIRTLLAWALQPVIDQLVAHGYLHLSDAQQFVASFAGVLAVIAWSAYQKHGAQLKLMIAASTPQAQSESEIEDTIHSGVDLPAVTTPKHAIPATPATFGR